MVFQRYIPSRTWTLNGSVVLDQPLPAIERDSDGYAVAVGDSDPSLLLPPDLVGATQAAVVDEGPAAPAAAVIGPGPQTTGLYTTQDAQGNSAAAHGLNYQWLLQGASYAQYELAAAGGGALVLYSMYLNTTIEHPGNVFRLGHPGPGQFRPAGRHPGHGRYSRGGRELDLRVRRDRPAADRPRRESRGHRGQGRPHVREALLARRTHHRSFPGGPTPAGGSWWRPEYGWPAGRPTRS